LSVAARRIAAYKRHQRTSQEKAQTSMLVVQSITLTMRPTQTFRISVDRRREKIPMRFNIYSAKTAAILVLGTAGLALTPHAQACGEPHGQLGLAALALLAPQLETQSSASLSTAQLTSPAAMGQENSNADRRQASIVGMWTVGFYHQDNQLWDVAIEQFSADGNEMTNDNAYPPAQGNLCWGVWTRVEKGQYKIKHIGWVFDANGSYFGRFDFAATLVLNDHGDGFTGTYKADQEDLSGNILPGFHDEGALKATRFKVD
jgi:hypothetical protein